MAWKTTVKKIVVKSRFVSPKLNGIDKTSFENRKELNIFLLKLYLSLPDMPG